MSLFHILADAHPYAVNALTRQYRMNADIMSISNNLVYNNRLEVGSDLVANRRLIAPAPAGSHDCMSDCGSRPCWIDQLIDERYVLSFYSVVLRYINDISIALQLRLSIPKMCSVGTARTAQPPNAMSTLASFSKYRPACSLVGSYKRNSPSSPLTPSRSETSNKRSVSTPTPRTSRSLLSTRVKGGRRIALYCLWVARSSDYKTTYYKIGDA